MWLNSILDTIGNTPLIKLNKITKNLPCTVLAKVEYFNPGNSIKDRMALKMLEVAEQEGKIKPGGTIIEGTSGNTGMGLAHSIKDRMALKMLEVAEQEGKIKPGGTIIEGTSGNTGMGLALAACVKGYKCIFTTTDKQSKEKADILKAVGAEVIVCPTNVEPEDPRSYYSVSKRLATEVPNSWYVNQYDNLANRDAHYEQTGPEIWEQTEGKVTHLVVATGTGGTIVGTGKYLKEKNPNIKVWAIDSYGSLLKKYFETGELDQKEVYPYISEGFGEDFVPANYDMSVIDEFTKVTDKDGAVMARRIAKEEGMFCGYSAGSCLQGMLQLAKGADGKMRLTKDDVVVLIFHDHGSRYVGKVYNDQWMLERGFLDVKTFKDLVAGRGAQKLIHLKAEDTVAEAIELMKKYDIENIPVMNKDANIGAISAGGLFNQILSNPDIKTQAVGSVMERSYPEVAFETPVERLSTFITKENGAVLSKDESGAFHIVTKYDIIQSLTK